jgi:hypothetical protein
MSTKYADRAFVAINGTPIIDVQSASVKQNFNARQVKSMTPDGFDRGFVKGNVDVDVNMVLAVENLLSSPKLEEIDYEANNVSLNFVCGADQYTVQNLFNKDVDQTASGVGEEVKKTFNFGALKVVDAVGNSVLFNLAL